MVSIDRVYQKVLAFANKEQRGYITPQEFNLFADQAQMEIFEQYFYDINQWIRQHGNSTGHSDMLTNLEEKVNIFVKYDQFVVISGNYGNAMTSAFTDIYRLEMIRVNYQTNTRSTVAEEIQLIDQNKYGKSPLGRHSKKRPVYTRYKGSSNSNAIKIYPYPSSDASIDKVYLTYIQTPATPNWGYVVVNDKALYNSTASTDFMLHASEESELVYRILAYAGISMKKPNLTQAAAGLEQAKVQQEKQ